MSTAATTTTSNTMVESSKKRQRDKEGDSSQFMFIKKVKGIPISESKVTFADIGGNDKVLKTVCKLLAHMKHPEIFKQLGISPPRGFLLHGPPGCGKTLLAYAIAGVRYYFSVNSWSSVNNWFYLTIYLIFLKTRS